MDQSSIPTQVGGLIPPKDCERLCLEILAREYSDPAYFAVHRLTVADIAGAPDASEHCARVHRWASEVWSAWQPQHERVRAWLATAH